MVRLDDWLETHAPAWLFELWCWPKYRVFGRCWAQGCGRLNVLHTPRQLGVCDHTPMAIEITERGMAYAVVCEAEELTAKAAAQ